jgi:hypothetical protein
MLALAKSCGNPETARRPARTLLLFADLNVGKQIFQAVQRHLARRIQYRTQIFDGVGNVPDGFSWNSDGSP